MRVSQSGIQIEVRMSICSIIIILAVVVIRISQRRSWLTNRWECHLSIDQNKTLGTVFLGLALIPQMIQQLMVYTAWMGFLLLQTRAHFVLLNRYRDTALDDKNPLWMGKTCLSWCYAPVIDIPQSPCTNARPQLTWFGFDLTTLKRYSNEALGKLIKYLKSWSPR